MEFMSNLEGNFFTQMERREPFTWRTCTGVGDIDVPKGEPVAQYCPDPLRSGQFRLEGFTKGGGGGAGTYSIVKPLLSTYNFLLHLDCEFVGRINWVGRGTRQNPRNYELAVILMATNTRRYGIPNPVAGPASGTPEETRVDTNADMVFSNPLVIYRLRWITITLTNTSDALSVYFLPMRCEDTTGPARGLCTEGIAGLEGPGAYAYEGEIKKTFDGKSWGVSPVDPYTWSGDTGAVLMFETLDAVRWLVFRSEAVIGAPAEVGISEDYGVSWTNVLIGNVFGQFVTAAVIVGGDVVVTCDDGTIYRSRDQGDTWEIVDDTTSGGAALADICFFQDKYGYAVGEGDLFMRTVGGSGGTWEHVNGPTAAAPVDLLSVAVNDMGQVFVGTDDGRLFRSEDQGDTWEQWVDLGGGTVDWIGFDPKAHYVGTLIYNPPDPHTDQGYVYKSEDGGADWFRMAGVPANDGLNAGFMCDENYYYMVGQVYNGTTFMMKTEIA